MTSRNFGRFCPLPLVTPTSQIGNKNHLATSRIVTLPLPFERDIIEWRIYEGPPRCSSVGVKKGRSALFPWPMYEPVARFHLGHFWEDKGPEQHSLSLLDYPGWRCFPLFRVPLNLAALCLQWTDKGFQKYVLDRIFSAYVMSITIIGMICISICSSHSFTSFLMWTLFCFLLHNIIFHIHFARSGCQTRELSVTQFTVARLTRN
jgi:hypothetical protein